MEECKLSVCISTYNQVGFIGECLDSLLQQATDFNFEIVISDDCSSDGTRMIVERYARENPEIIVNVSPEENGGPFKNYLNVHQAARGKYVAHMDGDDVALANKLQEQVDFLEHNPECNVVWHRMIFFDVVQEVEHPVSNLKFVGRPIYADEACLLGPMGPHSSTMYRKKNFNLGKFTEKCDDWLMAIFYMENGYAFMLDRVLGKYRLTNASMSAGARANKGNRELSTQSQIMAIDFNPKLAKYIATRASANFLLDFLNFRGYCILSLKVIFYSKSLPLFWRASIILQYYRWSKRPKNFN